MTTTLALTISPPYRLQGTLRRNPSRTMFEDDQLNIKTILNYNRIKKYMIFPEFSNKMRLHYHGILELNRNEYIRFHKHAHHKLKLMGLVDIKKLETFTDRLKWLCYCKKEWHITQEMLEISRPIWNNKICLDKKAKKEEFVEIEIPKNILDYFE